LAMHAIVRESVLRQLCQECRDMVLRLRKLGRRIERLAPPDACEVMTWLQPDVDELLEESETILEAIDAKA